MKRMELRGGDRRAADEATTTDDVVFVFNEIETRVTAGMTPAQVVKSHFDDLTKEQAARRAANPAYKIAREILMGQPEDVKNALRSLLND